MECNMYLALCTKNPRTTRGFFYVVFLLLCKIVSRVLFDNLDAEIFYAESSRLFVVRKPDIHTVFIPGVHPIFYHKYLVAIRIGEAQKCLKRVTICRNDAPIND